MATPAYLVRANLDALIGAGRVTQLFDDDHDGIADTATLDEVMSQAEGLALSFLLRGFSAAQVVVLAANDSFFLSQVAWVACELASERRGEFTAEDGKGRYWAQYTRAVTYFERLSKSQIHSKGESAAGTNKQSGGKIQPRNTEGKTEDFVFAPDEGSSMGRGGY